MVSQPSGALPLAPALVRAYQRHRGAKPKRCKTSDAGQARTVT